MRRRTFVVGSWPGRKRWRLGHACSCRLHRSSGLSREPVVPAYCSHPHTHTRSPTRHSAYPGDAGARALTGASLFSNVRDTRDKLVHILGSTDGQLFDLQRDPQEMDNLWSDAAHQGDRARLLQLLLDWRMQSSVQTMALGGDAR